MNDVHTFSIAALGMLPWSDPLAQVIEWGTLGLVTWFSGAALVGTVLGVLHRAAGRGARAVPPVESLHDHLRDAA